MNIVESHIIKKSHPNWKHCDDICFKSKNLYNAALYKIKNEFELNKKYLNYHEICKIMAESNDENYRALPAKVSQQTLMVLDRNYKAFFKNIKEFIKNPHKFYSSPNSPKFKHKTKGRFLTIFTQQAISKKTLLKNKTLCLSGNNIKISTFLLYNDIQQVKIIPLTSGSYKIDIVYSKNEKPLLEDNNQYAGIDLGVNNLFTICFNDQQKQNIIINGKPLKAINQFFNKKKSLLQSKLKNNITTSKKIKKLCEKRNNKIKDYIHKSTKKLVEILKHNNITNVVVGKNKDWKQQINIGKKNNQNFVSIPHAQAIDILSYKITLEGIKLQVIEEMYTSKCSSYDNEKICKHDVYTGRRIKRGLFLTKNGKLINADINGAANILKKAIPNAFTILNENGIEGVLVSPVKLTPHK